MNLKGICNKMKCIHNVTASQHRFNDSINLSDVDINP